jgi:hypothetical protein
MALGTFECFLGSNGTRPFRTVPPQCHPNQHADKHLRPPTPRSNIVALSCRPSQSKSAPPTFGRSCQVLSIADDNADLAILTRMTQLRHQAVGAPVTALCIGFLVVTPKPDCGGPVMVQPLDR